MQELTRKFDNFIYFCNLDVGFKGEYCEEKLDASHV